MADWKDILSDNNGQLSEEELLRYLDEETSDEEKAAIEEKAGYTPFDKDALEGLMLIKTDRVQNDVKQLNQKLHQQLLARKNREKKGRMKDFQWIILAILILLFIGIFGYIIIRLQARENTSQQRSVSISAISFTANFQNKL